jgi:hypothetical protein
LSSKRPGKRGADIKDSSASSSNKFIVPRMIRLLTGMKDSPKLSPVERKPLETKESEKAVLSLKRAL